MQHIDSEAVEIGVNVPANRPARSNPMQTPSIAMGRNVVPVLIESGSASMYSFSHNFPLFARDNYSHKNRPTGSIEQSPRFTEQFQEYLSTEDLAIMPAETQLREDLADAMRESPRDSGELITFYAKIKHIRRIEFCGFGLNCRGFFLFVLIFDH